MNKYPQRHNKKYAVLPFTKTIRISLMGCAIATLVACQGSPIDGASSSSHSFSSSTGLHSSSIHGLSSAAHSSLPNHHSSLSASSAGVASSVASFGTVVVDADSNGLIEISTLDDLNEIRNNLDGSALFGSNLGCPSSGCKGFELTNSLDFDANGDGLVNEQDPYWNDGAGWIAIGKTVIDSSNYTVMPFSAVFNGNGFTLDHLSIYNPAPNDGANFQVGLFSELQDAEIHNLGLINVFIDHSIYVGAIAGGASNSLFKGCFVTGEIRGAHVIGGMVGSLTDSSIEASYSHVTLHDQFGPSDAGLVGWLQGSEIRGSYSVVNDKEHYSYSGLGLASFSSDDSAIIASHTVRIHTNNTSQSPYASNEAEGILNYLTLNSALAKLKCPTAANDTHCASTTLYEGWEGYTDADGAAYWHFGTAQELPYLYYQTPYNKDSDGDGVSDHLDAFPYQFAAHKDSDSDGAPDINGWHTLCLQACKTQSGLVPDQFPFEPAAIIDLDLDGLADQWAPNCDASCQANSSVALDDLPNDHDNDGLPDDQDSDDNNDGITDIDSDSDGLIEVNNLANLNAVRYSLKGHHYKAGEAATANSSGCPYIYVNGVVTQRCHGHELTTDLDFDTNANGTLDEQDEYWNDGKGWRSIGPDHRNEYSGTFNGNGHVIHSQNNPLFWRMSRLAKVEQLGFTGLAERVNGRGVLADRAYGVIDSVFLVTPTDAYLVREGSPTLSNILMSSGTLGGAIFEAKPRSEEGQLTIKYSLNVQHANTALVSPAMPKTISPQPVLAFWNAPDDTSGIDNSHHHYASLAAFSCISEAPLTGETCEHNSIIDDWQSTTHSAGQPRWDFGSAWQLPGLRMGGQIYRDSDGDGILDRDDALPLIHGASIDSDNDGAPDSWSLLCGTLCEALSPIKTDQFPHNSAAAIDDDLDGMPDSWNSNCDASCQSASGLKLDPSPNDSDNDGLNNQQDSDDNNDGLRDADANSNGLIDIETLEELNAVRFNLGGTAQVWMEAGMQDNSGCPKQVVAGKAANHCHGYELLNNLDFDTSGDGEISASDLFWNDGAGWLPIAYKDKDAAFTAVFEGNGFHIKNLFMLDLPDPATNLSFNSRALFNTLEGAEVRNLGLSGPLTHSQGGSNSALLAAVARHSLIQGCYVKGRVTYRGGDSYSDYDFGSPTAGLVGSIYHSTLIANAAFTEVTGANIAGLVARAYDSTITANYSRSTLNTHHNVMTGPLKKPRSAGLVGYGLRVNINNSYAVSHFDKIAPNRLSATIAGLAPENRGSSSFSVGISVTTNNSYWAAENAASAAGHGTQSTLLALQCATQANDQQCANTPLFVDWQTTVDDDGQPYWHFGDSTQLPTLNIPFEQNL